MSSDRAPAAADTQNPGPCSFTRGPFWILRLGGAQKGSKSEAARVSSCGGAIASTAHRGCAPPTHPPSLLGRRSALSLRSALPPLQLPALLTDRTVQPSLGPQTEGNAPAGGPAPRTHRPARARLAAACGNASSLTWTRRGSLPHRSPCRPRLHYREVGGLALLAMRAERARGS